jgi:ketosteroid isomerase-like protein
MAPIIVASRWRGILRVMSEENVEIVRTAIDAFNRHDVDAWLAMCHEESELYSLRAQLEGNPYRGHEGLRQFLVDLDELWEYVRFDVHELRDAGERVVVLCDFEARARASGVELDSPVGVVFATRAGKVSYARFYSDPDEALEAAGLSE